MERPFARNARAILATAVGLIVLVTTAVGWLGWRLLSQEEALVRQQARDRLEQAADTLVAVFLRRLAEAEAWVSQSDSLAAEETAALSPATGAIVLRFSRTGVDAPPGELLYYPATPAVRSIDASLFAHAEKLEFQAADLQGAASALATLAASKDRSIRAKALLLLARVQKKRHQTTEALATYAKLADENLIGPAEVPYGLLSRFARCQLLADTQQGELARREAAALIASLEAGRWPIGKQSYAYYDLEARKLAGPPQGSAPLGPKLAVTETVESLWDEWQRFQQSGTGSLTKRVYSPGDFPTLAVLDATPEQLVALVYAGDSIRHLLDLASAGETPSGRVSLLDVQGNPILRGTPQVAGIAVTRSLAAAGLPWQLRLAADDQGDTAALLATRRNYFIVALVAIVALVSSACYAMARGVLREATAGQLQSDFVSAVSHEFRSPLTTLRQLTELLAHGRIQDESRRRLYFDVLQKETSRLHQLVENLLDFGRMDAGRRQYRIEPLDFSALVRDGIDEYANEASANGHRIELNADGRSLVVEADREALKRAVRNLLENAVKYSPDAPRVWVETGSDGQVAVLRVRDAGIGVPVEERSRIFEKFVRGEAAKKACIQGTGIGLAMVKEIVRAHRGDVDVHSEVGRGSTFTIRLPLSTAVQWSNS
jgi:signal transduction histidine kinase